jgi:uncharacterized membrane protein YgcG
MARCAPLGRSGIREKRIGPMQDLTGLLAMITLPGIIIVLVLRRAWRSRQGSSSGDSGSGDWSDGDGGGGDGGD